MSANVAEKLPKNGVMHTDADEWYSKKNLIRFLWLTWCILRCSASCIISTAHIEFNCSRCFFLCRDHFFLYHLPCISKQNTRFLGFFPRFIHFIVFKIYHLHIYTIMAFFRALTTMTLFACLCHHQCQQKRSGICF